MKKINRKTKIRGELKKNFYYPKMGKTHGRRLTIKLNRIRFLSSEVVYYLLIYSPTLWQVTRFTLLTAYWGKSKENLISILYYVY